MMIRALGQADAAAYRALRVRALRDHPEAFGRTPDEIEDAEALAERFARASAELDFVLGAFDGDTRLLDACLARARELADLDSLWLEVTTTNREARSLYASRGFKSAAIKPRTLKPASATTTRS